MHPMPSSDVTCCYCFNLTTYYQICMQTVWTEIRLLHMKQSDLGPHCLLLRLPKYNRQQTKCTLVVNRSQEWPIYSHCFNSHQRVNIYSIFCSLTLTFCHLLITFANSLDPGQDWQNVSPELVSLFQQSSKSKHLQYLLQLNFNVLSSADNLWQQFGPRSRLAECLS